MASIKDSIIQRMNNRRQASKPAITSFKRKDGSMMKSSIICRYGDQCRFGDKCRFTHPPKVDPRTRRERTEQWRHKQMIAKVLQEPRDESTRRVVKEPTGCVLKPTKYIPLEFEPQKPKKTRNMFSIIDFYPGAQREFPEKESEPSVPDESDFPPITEDCHCRHHGASEFNHEWSAVAKTITEDDFKPQYRPRTWTELRGSDCYQCNACNHGQSDDCICSELTRERVTGECPFCQQVATDGLIVDNESVGMICYRCISEIIPGRWYKNAKQVLVTVTAYQKI